MVNYASVEGVHSKADFHKASKVEESHQEEEQAQEWCERQNGSVGVHVLLGDLDKSRQRDDDDIKV